MDGRGGRDGQSRWWGRPLYIVVTSRQALCHVDHFVSGPWICLQIQFVNKVIWGLGPRPAAIQKQLPAECRRPLHNRATTSEKPGMDVPCTQNASLDSRQWCSARLLLHCTASRSEDSTAWSVQRPWEWDESSVRPVFSSFLHLQHHTIKDTDFITRVFIYLRSPSAKLPATGQQGQTLMLWCYHNIKIITQKRGNF